MAGQSGGLARVIEHTNNNTFGNLLEIEFFCMKWGCQRTASCSQSDYCQPSM